MTRIFVIAAFFLAAAPPSPPQTAGEEVKKPERIKFDRAAIPKDDAALGAALAADPEMVRGAGTGASQMAADYFIERWRLAYRLLDEYGYSPVVIEKSEEGDEWEVRAPSGAAYTFRRLGREKGIYILRFGYFYMAQVGIGLKLSGTGAVVFRTRAADGGDVLFDYDMYFAPGALPLDKITEYLPLQRLWIMEDFRSIAESFGSFIEDVTDNPESVADDMEFAAEAFTREEIAHFRKTFGIKR